MSALAHLMEPTFPLAKVLCAVSLLLAAGCSGDDDTAPDSGPTVGDDDDDDAFAVVAEVSPHVPSVMHLTGTVPADTPSDARLMAVATPTDAALPTLEVELAATPGASFVLPLSRLVQAQAYDVQVDIVSDDAVLTEASLSLTAPVAPNTLGSIQAVDVTGPIEPAFMALSLIGNDDTSYVVIVDDQARVVWWKPTEDGQIVLTPKLSRDGASLLWGEYAATKLADTGTWHRVRLDGTASSNRRMQLSHHAAVELPTGDIGWMGYDFRDVEGADGVVRRMATDRIFVGPEDATAGDTEEPVELFNTFDEHPDAPTITCEHISPTFDRFDERDVTEWTHGNSLAYVDSEDAYYINAKQTDWVLKIDGQTGELLWQLGGIGTDFTYPDGAPTWTSADEPTLFSHAHMSHVWEGGMVTFDNGDHRTPKVSSVAELAWNEDERTVERVWEFFHPDDGHTLPLGDVKKLDGGSYLVAWGKLSEVMVVDPDHTIRWHATVPQKFTLGRIVPLDAL